MNVYISIDGDGIGQKVGRASLANDVEDISRISQSIDRGNEIWKSWTLSTGGRVISMGGDECRMEIPADHLDDLPDLRNQYAETVGATVSVGVGMDVSEADRALLYAKVSGKDRIVLFDDTVAKAIEALVEEEQKHPKSEVAKLGEEYLKSELEKGDVLKFPQERVKPAGPPGEKATVRPIESARFQPDERELLTNLINQAYGTMGQDPGFQEVARKRDISDKELKLKMGPQAFGVGDSVICSHAHDVGGCSYPWSGTVVGYEPNISRDNGIHHYNVAWKIRGSGAHVGEGLHAQDELVSAFHKSEDLIKASGPFRAAGFLHKPSGKIFESGLFHDYEVLLPSDPQYLNHPEQYEEGFITHDGHFLDRKQAARAVDLASHKKIDGNQLYSEDDESGLHKADTLNQGAGAGMKGQSKPGSPGGFAGEASEHSQGEAALSAAADAPSPMEGTHANQDFEDQFHALAQNQDKEDQKEQESKAKIQGNDETRAQIIKVLEKVKAAAPILEQVKAQAPQVYEAVTSAIKAMLEMARELHPEGITKAENLEKGVMSRIAPFNPKKPVGHRDEYANEDDGTLDWVINGGFRKRHEVPPMSPEARLRALHKLHSHTTVRKNPLTGEREYLLHRGIHPRESLSALKNPNVVEHSGKTSWTPDKDIADWFGSNKKTLSAWISESKIHSIPRQVVDLNQYGDDQGESPVDNYRDEYEVIVNPHRSERYFEANPKTKPQDPNQINIPGVVGHGKPVPLPKSEEIEKALEIPKAPPLHHPLQLPIGSTRNGRVKVRHGDTGKAGWVSVRAGEILSHDGHPISSLNPGGR